MTSAPTLFAEPPQDAPTRQAGPFAAIALEQSVDRALDYSIPPALLSEIRVGQRVKVPLGRNNHPAHGYVVSIGERPATPGQNRCRRSPISAF